IVLKNQKRALDQRRAPDGQCDKGRGNPLLASETAEKPRVKPSPESNERVAPQPAAQPAPAFDALASDAFGPGASSPDALRPELLSDEAHRAAAERSAPWQVRHAN